MTFFGLRKAEILIPLFGSALWDVMKNILAGVGARLMLLLSLSWARGEPGLSGLTRCQPLVTHLRNSGKRCAKRADQTRAGWDGHWGLLEYLSCFMLCINSSSAVADGDGRALNLSLCQEILISKSAWFNIYQGPELKNTCMWLQGPACLGLPVGAWSKDRQTLIFLVVSRNICSYLSKQ